jgi:glycerol-3-phosphate acyltransferase PlsY
MDDRSVLFVIAAFLLGAIPFGKFIGRWVAQVDVTQTGSRNIGATNVARHLGIRWGLLTLLLDTLKGFLPVALYAYTHAAPAPAREVWLAAVGLSSLLGHQFSPFLHFRGGKGVATALGMFLALSPAACLLALPLFVITVYKWDYVSLGSLVSACAMPLLMTLLGRPGPLIAGSVLAAGLICLRHRDNIARLIKGEETRWRKREPQPSRSKSLSSSASE